jgi:hypothetical protein
MTLKGGTSYGQSRLYNARSQIEPLPDSAPCGSAFAVDLLLAIPLQLRIEKFRRNSEIRLFDALECVRQIEQILFGGALQNPDGPGDLQISRSRR